MQYVDRSFERAMALAALSGLKMTLGPAVLASARGWPARKNWLMAAMGEMFLDKLGVFPPRYRSSVLISHSLMGAWVARESLREDGEDDPWAVVAAGVVAASVAVAAPVARISIHKLTGLPDSVLGLAEDYLALSCASDVMEVPMEQLTGAAREMIEDAGRRVRPTLESMRLPV